MLALYVAPPALGYTPVNKAGDTMTGPLTLSAAGTALSVTNNATIGGVATVGDGVKNKLSVTPGAASSNAITVGQSGTGGLTFIPPLTVSTSFLLPNGAAFTADAGSTVIFNNTPVFNANVAVSGLQNAADDAAAAVLGVAVGQFYRDGSLVCVRVS